MTGFSLDSLCFPDQRHKEMALFTNNIAVFPGLFAPYIQHVGHGNQLSRLFTLFPIRPGAINFPPIVDTPPSDRELTHRPN